MIHHTRRSSVPRRRALFLGFGVLLAALGAAQVAAGRRAPAQPKPQLPVAVVESVLSQTPTVSADGRWVVYSGIHELRTGDIAGVTEPSSPTVQETTIWLKDRADNSLIDLTPPRIGIREGQIVWPVISGDGCTVTIITELALDLFRDDDLASRWDVYRLLLPRCGGEAADLGNGEYDWELVSATKGSGFEVTAGDDVSPVYPPAVSGDGNVVAYTRQFSEAESDNASGVLGVTVVDLTIAIGEMGRARPVAGTPAAAPNSTFRYRGLREPTISADGNVLAYTSDADSAAIVPDWGTGLVEGGFAVSNVYVWDRTPPAPVAGSEISDGIAPVADPVSLEGRVRAISTVSSGVTGDASSPSLSGNGRFVAFVSTATNLIPGATLPPCSSGLGAVCLPQVYLFDRDAPLGNSLSLASREPGDPLSPPIAADAGATQPSLNYGGEELLFVSRSNNLFPTHSLSVGDADDGDIVLAIPALGTIDRVSVLADGMTPGPAANSHPHMSAVGRVVVFDTLAGAVYGTPQVGRQVAVVEHTPDLLLANLDVGTVAVWFPGPEWFLVLSNSGPASFLPVTATVDNEDFLISGGSCLEPAAAVPAGGTCTIKLMLLPTAAGERKGTLTVSEAEGSFNAVSISAELSGRGGEPSLAPTPAGGYAGSILVGSNAEPLSFEMSNVAFGSVRVKSVSVEGSNPDDFHVTLDDCTGKTLTPGATNCNLQVVFTPTAAGRRSAQVIVVTRDGGHATMIVSGDAFYRPQLIAATGTGESTIQAGSRLKVVGWGYAPNTNVTISWADGSGGSVTTMTDATGGLNAQLVIRATDRAGLRTIVAQSSDGSGDEVASVDVLILAPGNSRGPSSPVWPGN